MALVPYTFASQAGPIPLSELDADFAALAAATSLFYTVDTGAANALVGTNANITGALVAGQPLLISAANSNSSTSVTLNLNGTGALPLQRMDGSTVQVGDILAGKIYLLALNNAVSAWSIIGVTSAATSGLLPKNTQTASYTVAASDSGGVIYLSSGTDTVTLPANASVPIGQVFLCNVVNTSGNSATIAPAGGVTLNAPGIGTGNRTLASPGMCTLSKTNTNEWFITGAGLT